MYTWAPHPHTKISQCPHWEWERHMKTKKKNLKRKHMFKNKNETQKQNNQYRKRKATNYTKRNWNKTKKTKGEEKRERRREEISSKPGQVLSTPKLPHTTITDQGSVNGVLDTPHLLGLVTPEIVSNAGQSL